MKILEIYKKYQLMPQLGEHMLRVAGVASVILDNFDGEVELEKIIKACLLHDMGNIVKFDFSLFPEVVAEKGLEYWEKVKQETKEKYGGDAHTATANILKELKVSTRIFELAESVSFYGAKEKAQGDDWGKKICQYADDRVNPWGVVSLEERLLDLRQRYADHAGDGAEKKEFEESLWKIQSQIFAHCKIRPEEITEEMVRGKLEELRNYDI